MLGAAGVVTPLGTARQRYVFALRGVIFCGQCPRTMRYGLHGANCCPAPLGNVTFYVPEGAFFLRFLAGKIGIYRTDNAFPSGEGGTANAVTEEVCRQPLVAPTDPIENCCGFAGMWGRHGK